MPHKKSTNTKYQSPKPKHLKTKSQTSISNTNPKPKSYKLTKQTSKKTNTQHKHPKHTKIKNSNPNPNSKSKHNVKGNKLAIKTPNHKLKINTTIKSTTYKTTEPKKHPKNWTPVLYQPRKNSRHKAPLNKTS